MFCICRHFIGPISQLRALAAGQSEASTPITLGSGSLGLFILKYIMLIHMFTVNEVIYIHTKNYSSSNLLYFGNLSENVK